MAKGKFTNQIDYLLFVNKENRCGKLSNYCDTAKTTANWFYFLLVLPVKLLCKVLAAKDWDDGGVLSMYVLYHQGPLIEC